MTPTETPETKQRQKQITNEEKTQLILLLGERWKRGEIAELTAREISEEYTKILKRPVSDALIRTTLGNIGVKAKPARNPKVTEATTKTPSRATLYRMVTKLKARVDIIEATFNKILNSGT